MTGRLLWPVDMGSYNLACMLSGLPIASGDGCYAMLLTGTGRDGVCDPYPNAVWSPRTPALRGTYGDKGLFELDCTDVDETLASGWTALLDADAVEQGHPSAAPVRKGMGLRGYLDAVHDGTLFVQAKVLQRAWDASRLPPGLIPTVAGVVAELAHAGLRANEPDGRCFTVVEYEPGEVAVLCPNDERWCEDAARALADGPWAVAITAARGFFGEPAIRIFPKPGSEGQVGPMRRLAKDEPKRVGLGLVRADIWDALLAWPLLVPLDDYISDERAVRTEYLSLLADKDDFCDLKIDRFAWDPPRLVAGHLVGTVGSDGSSSPGITGWEHHYRVWVEYLHEGYGLYCADSVGRRFAEGVLIYRHLAHLNRQVAPSPYAGQQPAWGRHAEFGKLVHNIAAAAAAEGDE